MALMVPSPGRIVHYTLSANDATVGNGSCPDGNKHAQGDVLPMIIVRVWADDPSPFTSVNGQVLLDGGSSGGASLWVTSRQQGDGEAQWHEPPRV